MFNLGYLLTTFHLHNFELVLLLCVCAFSQRNFGIALNRPFDKKLPLSDLQYFTGTYADFIWIVFHKIISDGHVALKSLHKTFLEITANVSAYVKG